MKGKIFIIIFIAGSLFTQSRAQQNLSEQKNLFLFVIDSLIKPEYKKSRILFLSRTEPLYECDNDIMKEIFNSAEVDFIKNKIMDSSSINLKHWLTSVLTI